MDLNIFLNQVILLLFMLTGMFFGESITSSLFGYVRGKLSKLLYLLFFVFFIVFGNYLPSLMGIQLLGFLESILLFSVWGFLSVFFSRALVFMLDFLSGLPGRLKHKKKNNLVVDAGRIIACLWVKGLDWEGVNFILSDLLGSQEKAASLQRRAEKGRLKQKIQVNPCRLAAAVHRRGFTAEEVTELLVSLFRMTPEQAANIWAKST